MKELIPAETCKAAGIDKLACDMIPCGSRKYCGKISIPNINMSITHKILNDLFKSLIFKLLFRKGV